MIDVVRVVLERTPIDLGVICVSNPKLAEKVLRNYIQDYCDQDRENLVILCVDTKLKINAIHTLAVGGINKCSVNMLQVFKICALSNSPGFFLAHNHPTGDVTPSDDDFTVIKKLQKGAKRMGLKLMDNIIIGDKEVYSMRAEGHLTD
jgi:DNA repair protein RadC